MTPYLDKNMRACESHPTKKPAKWSNNTASTVTPNSLDSIVFEWRSGDKSDDRDAPAIDDFRWTTFSANTLK